MRTCVTCIHYVTHNYCGLLQLDLKENTTSCWCHHHDSKPYELNVSDYTPQKLKETK